MSELEEERLAKRMARAGLCSRREAESWITAGRVKVDGSVVRTPAYNVGPQSHIEVDGTALDAPQKTRVWRYHKPAGLITTHKDPQGRPTIFAHLPKNLPRVVSVGRLDLNSEGLLLLTNDGALARALELPASGLERSYRVRVYGHISQDMITRMARGVTVEGVRYGAIHVEPEPAQGSNSWVKVRLTEGKNREIRRVFEYFGCRVNRLIRTAYGPVKLDRLSRGEVEEVPPHLLKKLMKVMP